MSRWEQSYVDYYPDTDEGYNKVIEGETGVLQVEHTQAGWHGLILSWEAWDEDESGYDEDLHDEDNVDDTGGLTLMDECVFTTRLEAQNWCEDQIAEESM